MTVATRALSADAALLARLRSGPFRASVHSVFDRVINVHCAEDDRLYTLACRRSDDAPCTLVVDIPSFASLGVRAGTPAASDGAELVVGRALAVDLASAAPWSSTLPPWPAHGIPVRWARAFVDREGVGGGVKPRSGPRNAVEVETGRRLSAATAGLQAALLAGRMDEAHRRGRRLIGLGPGLTPAGDDYVLGLATVCAMPGGSARARECRDLLARLIDDNAERTNVISQAAMAQAARGRVRDSIVRFAHAITGGSRPAMEVRARRLIAIGATSGTDIMLGMLAGLQLGQVGSG
jgi:hypothetical protein